MSPKVNWDDYNESSSPKRESFPPGIYHVEVESAEERTSASGNGYFSVRLKDMESNKTVCFDIIMLQGKGIGIGLQKLMALGFSKEDSEIVAAELMGRRAFVALKQETYEGQKRLAVDISAKGSSVGYWTEDNPPQEMTPGESDVNDLNAPF